MQRREVSGSGGGTSFVCRRERGRRGGSLSLSLLFLSGIRSPFDSFSERKKNAKCKNIKKNGKPLSLTWKSI